MLLRKIIEPLIMRNNALQCSIASVAIRSAAIEAGHRPGSVITVSNDRADGDSPCLLAIREGAQLGYDQLLDLILGLGKLIHDANLSRHRCIEQQPLNSIYSS